MQEVLNFWFQELKPEQWWKVDPILDDAIRQKFGKLHQQASMGELWDWRKTPEGRLAEIIVLDQFSRNIYRGKPQAFACDGMALMLAQQAIDSKTQLTLDPTQRAFLYLPFMHSESRKIHEIAVKLFQEPGLELNYDFELKHKAIIDRFGHYPHRNAILGRESTQEELEFLKQPGSGF